MIFVMAGAKIRYYKDVTLCENYVRDFLHAAKSRNAHLPDAILNHY